jgi:hypothetical protein
MTRRIVTTQDLNPFKFTWIDQRLEKVNTAWLLIPGVIMVLCLCLVSAAEGAFGSTDDFRLWDDVQSAMGLRPARLSEPDFPLMRDVTTWFLIGTVIAGMLLLHRQWQYMSKCLSGLAENGAIVHREQRKSNFISRMLGVDRITANVTIDRALNTLIGAVQGKLSQWSKLVTFVLFIASIILALVLVFGWKNSLFQQQVPEDLTGVRRQRWLNDAYESWWASDSNAPGYILYILIAIFAIFIILSFQFVGLVAIYVTIAMHFLIEPSADWLNRDGCYGWAPMARVYRTAVWANVTLGLTLSSVILALGIQNYAWIMVLLVLYLLLMPVFALGPWLAFRRAGENAVRLRCAEIDAIIADNNINVERDVEKMAPYLAEIDRCRSARVRPLRRLGTISVFTYIGSIILPIALAVAQIYFTA